MSDSTLMFGLGATRAGSTWLYRYFADHPDCGLPRVKELHYFDALDFGGQSRQLKRLGRLDQRAKRQMKNAQTEKRRASILRWRQDLAALTELMSHDEDPEAYVSYLTDGRTGKLHGDITPAYALLSEARLKMMAGLAKTVKFVFFLRDPVDRLWSNIRQAARIKAEAKGADPEPEEIQRHASSLFERYIGEVESNLRPRSDYRDMLRRFERAIPRENIFVGFYEQLFRTETIDALCAFLGIRPVAADFARVSNVADEISMTPAQRAKLQRELAPQYDYAEQWFGGDLPDRWTQNRIRI